MNPVDWQRVEWVILDMDGTFLDLAYDNYFWRELVPERFARKNGLTLDAAKAELTPRFAAVAHTLPWYCTDYWSTETGLDIAGLKREVRARIRVLPGVRDFLAAVRASGRKLWVATNAHADSWTLKLEHTGLREYFDVIVSSHDYGAPKEDPRFWQTLAERHPFVKGRALFADDSLPVLHAARAFGIGQIVAMTEPDSSQPPRVVTGFATTPQLSALLPIA